MMRRKDRERDRDFALSVVDACPYATLSMIDPEGNPYGVPVNLVRDGDEVYFHAALEGKKTACLRHAPRVWISCVSHARVLADEYATAYNAAMIAGAAAEVTDEAEKTRALRLLCERFVSPRMDKFDEEVSRSLSRTAIWKIHIEAITGKQKPDPQRAE